MSESMEGWMQSNNKFEEIGKKTKIVTSYDQCILNCWYIYYTFKIQSLLVTLKYLWSEVIVLHYFTND